MSNVKMADLELDRVMTALGDATRRGILTRLAAGEARVTDIASAFPISLNSISKHIRALERSGLLERRIRGREHFLRFQPRPLRAAQAWIVEHEAFWANRLQALDAVLSDQNPSATQGEDHD